jgi:hypothetical protein
LEQGKENSEAKREIKIEWFRNLHNGEHLNIFWMGTEIHWLVCRPR